MTTEDDFQLVLNAQPDDWQTLLVFADWLDERCDPRGPGYRAMGLNRLAPSFEMWHTKDTHHWTWHQSTTSWHGATLIDVWFCKIEGAEVRLHSLACTSLMDAFDRAARAFVKLGPHWRVRLLKPTRA